MYKSPDLQIGKISGLSHFYDDANCYKAGNPLGRILTKTNISSLYENNGESLAREESKYSRIIQPKHLGDSLKTCLYIKDELKNIPEKTHVLISTVNYNGIGNILDINKYSDLNELFRVTSYILRYISNLKRKHGKDTLQLTDYVMIREMRNSKSYG